MVFPIHVIVYWEHTRSYLKVPFQVQKENTFTAQISFILGANYRYIDNLQNIARWFTSKLFWNSKFNFGPFFFNLGPFKAKSRLPIKKNTDVYAFCSIGLSNKLFFHLFFHFLVTKFEIWRNNLLLFQNLFTEHAQILMYVWQKLHWGVFQIILFHLVFLPPKGSLCTFNLASLDVTWLSSVAEITEKIFQLS